MYRVCSLLLFLSGCQLIPPYQGPLTPTPAEWKSFDGQSDAIQPALPDQWKEEESSTNELGPDSSNSPPCLEDVRKDLSNWWEIFEDPVLNELEERALDSSYTLWAALEKLLEARAQARISFTPLLPGINFTPAYTKSGTLFQNPFPSLPCCGSNATLSLPKDFRYVQSQYLVPLTLSYEVDLWKKLDNAYLASLIKAQAASQAYLNVLLSLTADVASTYFQIRSLDAQLEVILGNIRLRQKAVDLNRARYEAGIIVYLDVSMAELELARAQSDGDDVRRARGLQENLLATLVGTPSPIFSLPYHPVQALPPTIPTGLPSELLCRRPDIAEAERNLAAAYRQIGVAYANFFPSLILNGGIGYESPFIPQLFSWKSRFWEMGYNIVQTVFDAGRNEANLDYYKALYRESMANYQEQVLTAFQDVENALVDLKGYAQQAKDLANAVQAARKTLQLSQMRYQKGLTTYLNVVDAERQLLQTEQTAVIVLGNRFVSTVMLIRALGGGWGPCDTCGETQEHNSA